MFLLLQLISIIMPVVLYACEVWSLTLREKRRLTYLKTESWGEYLDPTGMNGERRTRHNQELHCLYRSHNIVRVIKSRRLSWAGHVARMKEGRSVFKILTGTPTGKRPSGRPRREHKSSAIYGSRIWRFWSPKFRSRLEFNSAYSWPSSTLVPTWMIYEAMGIICYSVCCKKYHFIKYATC